MLIDRDSEENEGQFRLGRVFKPRTTIAGNAQRPDQCIPSCFVLWKDFPTSSMLPFEKKMIVIQHIACILRNPSVRNAKEIIFMIDKYMISLF